MRSLSYQLLILLFAFQTDAHSQVPYTDSLQKVIKSNAAIPQKIMAYTALARLSANRNFDTSFYYAMEGASMAGKIKDTGSLGECYRLAGAANYFKGNYDSTAYYLYMAIEYLGKAKNNAGKALALNDLGKLYRKTKDLDRALQTYNEAYLIYEGLHDEDGMATILNESGVVFEYKGKYDEAIGRYEKSLRIREKLHDTLGESYSLNFIGGAYTMQKQFNKAAQYLQQSLELRKLLKDSFTIALSYADLGAMYHEKKDFEKAMSFYLLSNEIALQMKYPQLLSENYLNLSSISEKKGNPALSLSYFKQYTALKDSVFSTEKMKQIEELNAKYQSEKKEQQLKLQEAVIQKKNFLLWGIVIIALLLIYTGFTIYRKRKAQATLHLQQVIMQEQDLATRAVIDAEEKERKRIAADLHDGIGQMMSAAKMNLSVFESELPFTNEQQKHTFENVISMVDECCREIRSVSHQMMPNALLKSGLASAVKAFIDKIDNRIIQVSLHTEGLNDRIDSNTETVLYRVIQECVNNVIRHSGASTMDISLIKDTDGISVTIEDNGKGFIYSGNGETAGIGLKNILSRINYLKGTVDFDTAPGKGTLVAIHIPVSV